MLTFTIWVLIVWTFLKLIVNWRFASKDDAKEQKIAIFQACDNAILIAVLSAVLNHV